MDHLVKLSGQKERHLTWPLSKISVVQQVAVVLFWLKKKKKKTTHLDEKMVRR